jgi:hypothetical protein
MRIGGGHRMDVSKTSSELLSARCFLSLPRAAYLCPACPCLASQVILQLYTRRAM